MVTSLESRLTKKISFVLRDTDPTPDDNYFTPPHLWLNRESNAFFVLTDVTDEVARWEEIQLK